MAATTWVTRSLLVLAVALAGRALVASAAAADLELPVKARLPPPPSYSWSGWHVGINLGYGVGPSGDGSLGVFSTAFGLPAAVAAGFVPPGLGLGPSGIIGGGQVGYDWQFGAYLAGLETDFQGSGISDANTLSFPGGGGFVPSTTSSQDALAWFGTLRARLGVLPLPRLLLYATGGLAYGEVRDSFSVVGTPPAAGNLVGADRSVRAGWTAGAGVEWAATDHLALRAEYLYLDFGTDTVRGPDVTGFFPGTFIDYRIRLGYDIFRAGIDYKF